MTDYYIGLMSGTSIDAIDIVIADVGAQKVKIIAADTYPIPPNIKQAILALCQPGANEIDRMGELDYELGHLFGEAANHLMQQVKIEPTQIKAIGSHGQTIRHRPDAHSPFTLQIGNPALIAQNCNITTVADFRRADMAAGGQGAPLVPGFHHALFAHEINSRAVINIGGMANISILPTDKNAPITGFDTGPGNVLLNAWINAQQNQAYDENGAWSAAHSYNESLLQQFLTDPYFQKPPPKSTGRELFDMAWINRALASFSQTIEPGVIQSTLCELTARSIANAIERYAKNTSEIFICGGGAHNRDLLKRITAQSPATVKLTDELGINADFVEAAAFAWFARQTLHGQHANVPSVTGAKNSVILGAIYPR